MWFVSLLGADDHITMPLMIITKFKDIKSTIVDLDIIIQYTVRKDYLPFV